MIQQNSVDVLVVDDRVDGLLAIKAAIDIPNVKLVMANSGREALGLLDSHDFALILLDVQMPELDGFETAVLIRRHANYKATPIIFVTAINKDDRYVYKGYDVGAVDYVFKPIDDQVLKSKVQVFVDLYIKNCQLAEIESLKRYRTLADSIPHIVWKSRNDGFFDYFNQVWLEYTGLTTEQSVGMGWQEAVHPDDLPELLKVWIGSMNVADPFQAEGRFRRHDGEMRWHLVKAVPEFRAGQVSAWIGTCTDIHDKKLVEDKLIAAERLAVAANIAKTTFLANMSHEIRTPMNAILGFSELILDGTQTVEDRLHCAQTIYRSGQQLLGIIDEILDISKIEAGRLEIEKIYFNLPMLIRDLRSLMEIQAQSKNLELIFKLQSLIPQSIYSDPMRVRQILVNVIGNALKYTIEGSVSVELDWKDEKLLIKVCDTGIGIDSVNVDKLFQPFVQLDSSPTRKFGGTGLGLFLSRQLAQALGGTIRLHSSQIGQGSIFAIEIEAKMESNKRFVSVIEDRVVRKISEVQSHNKALKGIKILLAEDSVENQEIITYFLHQAGAEVELAENGIEAVEKTMSGQYNIVLMDIQMPELDGYKATSRLRESGYQGPIVALTAHALKEEKQRCLRAGCTDHMTKPIDRGLLIERVEQLASKL